jgi:hypothetical protein
MTELKNQILGINNAAQTLVWISYIDGLFPNRLVLSCYHTTASWIVLNFTIREMQDGYRVTCEKYLKGSLLCVVDSVVGEKIDVLKVVVTMLKMGYGGVA